MKTPTNRQIFNREVKRIERILKQNYNPDLERVVKRYIEQPRQRVSQTAIKTLKLITPKNLKAPKKLDKVLKEIDKKTKRIERERTIEEGKVIYQNIMQLIDNIRVEFSNDTRANFHAENADKLRDTFEAALVTVGENPLYKRISQEAQNVYYHSNVVLYDSDQSHVDYSLTTLDRILSGRSFKDAYDINEES